MLSCFGLLENESKNRINRRFIQTNTFIENKSLNENDVTKEKQNFL